MHWENWQEANKHTILRAIPMIFYMIFGSILLAIWALALLSFFQQQQQQQLETMLVNHRADCAFICLLKCIKLVSSFVWLVPAMPSI